MIFATLCSVVLNHILCLLILSFYVYISLFKTCFDASISYILAIFYTKFLEWRVDLYSFFMSEISKKQNAFESTFRAQEIFNLVVPHHVENSSISIKGIMTCVTFLKVRLYNQSFLTVKMWAYKYVYCAQCSRNGKNSTKNMGTSDSVVLPHRLKSTFFETFSQLPKIAHFSDFRALWVVTLMQQLEMLKPSKS